MILDQYGRPLESSTPNPGLRGGWVQAGGIGSVQPGWAGKYGVDRTQEQRKSRVAYFQNPVFWAAVQVVQSYIIGDVFSWGDHPDRRVKDTLDELAAVNDLPDLAERFWTEFMLDGENATVWVGTLRPTEPARVAFLDIENGVELEHSVTTGITSIKADRETWDSGEFVWTAWDALYNDPRGWPVGRHAVDACLSSIRLINHRLRAQEINGRINAVYKALVNAKTPDGGLSQQLSKAAVYSQIPRDGAVLTLAVDKDTGRSEEMEFLDLARGASDAASDARLIRLVIAAVIGVPEHFLGEGGNVTRTTADAMGDPARKAFSRRQAKARSWADRMLRTELVRRFGPDQTYRVPKAKVTDGGRTRSVSTQRVPASQIEGPWVFPDLSSDNLAEVTRMVDMAVTRRLMSMQTGREKLGLDPAVEVERLQIEDETGDKPPDPQTGGPPPVTEEPLPPEQRDEPDP